ncbi:hypothetical protein CYMTET_37729 [Cymbomonas tetramitiformis]|uniref:F-box domain-containing protein n=1 Tax=Cymbomonas tetramitiformis TaxID=36881 RepID=A0AAE0F7B4_9CHLO|nr:hypothetical protein CYMTET_37729 [Cymbomonas tetramitiformis]
MPSARVTTFDAVSPHLFLRILSTLSPQDLCGCACVSRAWRSQALDPSLWTDIRLDLSRRAKYPGSCLEALERLAARCPLLTRLDLSCDANDFYLEPFTRYCGHMRQAVLRFSDVTDDGVNLLVSNCSQIEALDLQSCHYITKSSLRLLIELPNLRVLNLAHCRMVSVGEADGAAVAIACACPSLRHLDVDGWEGLTDSGCEALFQGCPALVTLCLDGASLTDACIPPLVETLHDLKKLSISFCEELTDVGIAHLARRSVHLTSIRLRKGIQLSDAGIAKIFEPRQREQHEVRLHHVDISECHALQMLTLSALVSASGYALRDVNLAWCWQLRDAEITLLLEGSPRLELLDLTGLEELTGKAFRCLQETDEGSCMAAICNIRKYLGLGGQYTAGCSDRGRT